MQSSFYAANGGEERVMNEQGYRVETSMRIADPRSRRSLWEGYLESHEISATLCIQEQRCFTEESFDAAMTDPEYVKFVLFSGDEIVGMIGGTNNLEKAKVAYVNPERLIAAYPPAAQGKLWYMPLLFIRKAWQGMNCSNLLFEAMTRFFLDRGDAFASDFANDKHPRFLELLNKTVGPPAEKLGNPPMALKHTVLGGQTYFITEFVPKG